MANFLNSIICQKYPSPPKKTHTCNHTCIDCDFLLNTVSCYRFLPVSGICGGGRGGGSFRAPDLDVTLSIPHVLNIMLAAFRQMVGESLMLLSVTSR